MRTEPYRPASRESQHEALGLTSPLIVKWTTKADHEDLKFSWREGRSYGVIALPAGRLIHAAHDHANEVADGGGTIGEGVGAYQRLRSPRHAA